MSTNTGVAPTRVIAPAVAKNVYGLVMTSSPLPVFSAIRQASSASLPDETPTACGLPQYCAIACSHCSTLGPRMKCCDSSTSRTAASTSALMARYCDLRPSNGTFMLGLISHLSVRFCAPAQLRGERRFLVQIQTTEGPRFGFLVAVAAFRARHDAVRVRSAEPMSVPAHPSHLPAGVADDECEIWH